MIKVIDYWAPWCGPCKVMAPTIEKLATQYADNENVQIEKVNVDENMEEARASRVQSIPTLVFFKDGEEVNRLTGLKTEAVIKEAIEALLVN